MQQEEVHQPTGDELCLLTDLEPLEVKRLMTQIEEDGALGRLFDIDVMTAESPKISRQQLSLPPRRCLLCEQQAAVCARSQAHDIRQLQSRTVKIICEQLMGRYAEDIASTACRALLYEVHTAPKPGLVDRENSGAHSDMQETTFFDSSCALYPYFRQQQRHLPKTALEGQASRTADASGDRRSQHTQGSHLLDGDFLCSDGSSFPERGRVLPHKIGGRLCGFVQGLV